MYDVIVIGVGGMGSATRNPVTGPKQAILTILN